MKKKIICFGDSITECAGYAEADRWTTQLAFLVEEKMPGQWEVHNRGVGGDTTGLALDRFQTDILPLLPGIVFVEFGINDTYVFQWRRTPRVNAGQFEQNLREIIWQIREAKGDPVLIINHPVTRRKDLHRQGDGFSIGRRLSPYNRIIRKLAKDEVVPYVDLPALLKTRNICTDTFISDDGVHLSPEGNRVYARLLLTALPY